MVVIDIHFPSKESFLKQRLDLDPFGLFVPGEFDVSIGSRVALRCVFPSIPEGVIVCGTVQWRRLGHKSSSLPPGLGVRLLAPWAHQFRFLEGFAEGRAEHRRSDARFDVDIPIQCFKQRAPDKVSYGFLRNVSRQGAQLKCSLDAMLGELVVVRYPEHAGTAGGLVAGTVAWRRRIGDRTGLGLHLRFGDADEAGLWEQFVERVIEEQIGSQQ